MTQEISALMDGELEAHEAEGAIRVCCASETGVQKWNEYHLIGEAMRGHAPRQSRTAVRVVAALAHEPTVLAPRAAPRRQGLVRFALAAAASVATVAAVGWIGFTGAPGVQQPTVAQTSAPANLPSSSNKTVIDTRVVAHTESVPLAANSPGDLHDYLAAHRQIPSPDYYRPVATTVPARGR